MLIFFVTVNIRIIFVPLFIGICPRRFVVVLRGLLFMAKKNKLIKYSQLVKGYRWYYARLEDRFGKVLWVSERYMSRNGRNKMVNEMAKSGDYLIVKERLAP